MQVPSTQMGDPRVGTPSNITMYIKPKIWVPSLSPISFDATVKNVNQLIILFSFHRICIFDIFAVNEILYLDIFHICRKRAIVSFVCKECWGKCAYGKNKMDKKIKREKDMAIN